MEAIFKGTEEAPQLRIRRGGFSYTQESCSSDLKGSKVSIQGKSRRQRNIEDVWERGEERERKEKEKEKIEQARACMHAEPRRCCNRLLFWWYCMGRTSWSVSGDLSASKRPGSICLKCWYLGTTLDLLSQNWWRFSLGICKLPLGDSNAP